ncbi:FRG domain-containing protein [Legionella sp. 29fVS95]|uniref:FRG domain-containing protein n=1 Tax=Legionella sp. 29fVS95 TaxID=3402813 RepID=UPI003AF87C5C
MDINDKKIQKDTTTAERQFSDWGDFTSFIYEYKDKLKNCIYRGQRDPTWRLTPTIYRFVSSANRDQIIRLRNIHLDFFKKHTRGRHTISFTDPSDSEENWWALGQHYGLVTPLLDWVYSPYVAAFFSFNAQKNLKSSRAIHIVDLDKIEKILRAHNRTSDRINEIRKIDPLMHENQRLVSQQGIFTLIEDSHRYNNFQCVEDYLDTFIDRFSTEIGNEILHLKILIPESEREVILEHLNLMNINELTLFPDLNGAANYCNYLLNKESNE